MAAAHRVIWLRQTFEMQQSFRKGTWTELMKPIVANLTTEDVLNIVAYRRLEHRKLALAVVLSIAFGGAEDKMRHSAARI